MTYFGFLLRFIFLPIMILILLTRLDQRAGRDEMPGFQAGLTWRAILIHILLALVYTTPWDNYLVATGVWSYAPKLVTGVVLGWVPVEEYTFFVMQTLLCGLWWAALARRLPAPGDFQPSPTGRWLAVGGLLLVWLFFAIQLFDGPRSATYLSITLFWALPAILPQVLLGADILWHQRRLLFWTILPAGLYLSLTDMAALQAGTWSISAQQTTGLRFFGLLPLEEVVFFFITSSLVAFGLTLLLSTDSRQRLVAWREKGWRGMV